MKYRFKRFAAGLLLCLSLWSSGAFAASVCSRLLNALPEGSFEAQSFWKQTDPYGAGPDEGDLPFRFGFDAELWHLEDVVNIISKDAGSLAACEKKLRQQGPFYTQAELATMLAVSPAQLASFLRVANSPTAKYVLTDITVDGLKRWKHDTKVKSQYAEVMQPFVESSLKSRSIPVTAILENDSGPNHEFSVELVMDGSTASPAEFKKLIDWLYAETVHPETHFHVSLPVDHVSATQTLYAARALETKILLELMLSDQKYDGETYHPYDDSSFTKNPRAVKSSNDPQVERGLVRVESYRWDGPEAHDVEIREWIDRDHGLENMYFLMELVRHSDKLRKSPSFQTSELRDTMPPNLNGALRYAALMLKDRLPVNKSHIAVDLEQLASELERAGKIDEAARKKITAYLSTHNVLQYLEPDVFLKTPVFRTQSSPASPPPVQPTPPPQASADVPLPGPYVLNGTRFRFTNPGGNEAFVRARTHVLGTDPEERGEFLADFTLDWDKAIRSNKYNVQPNETVIFFDWIEPDTTDASRVVTAAREVIRRSFQEFKAGRLVAAANQDDTYADNMLRQFGFKPLAGAADPRSNKQRYELQRGNFR